MLDYISGTIAEIGPATVVVDNHGMGYMINISLTTYDAISAVPPQEVVRVYVYEVIREDTHDLYGFATRRERELFLLLIGVSGVGPNTARTILSAGSAEQLEQSIAAGDADILKAVKGVGAKTAQRIIVDLKDKIKVGGGALIEDVGTPAGLVFEQAQAALVMLGFTKQQSAGALKKLLKSQPSITVEDAIKQSLKMM